MEGLLCFFLRWPWRKKPNEILKIRLNSLFAVWSIWSYGDLLCRCWWSYDDHMIIWSSDMFRSYMNISGFPQWSIWSIVIELSCSCRLTDEHFFQFCHRKKDLKGLKKTPIIWRSRGTRHPTLKGNVSWNWGKTSFPVWLISEPPSSPFHSILPDFGVFLRYVLSQSVTGPTVFETKSFTSPVILQVSFGCDLFEFRSSGISNLDLFFSHYLEAPKEVLTATTVATRCMPPLPCPWLGWGACSPMWCLTQQLSALAFRTGRKAWNCCNGCSLRPMAIVPFVATSGKIMVKSDWEIGVVSK